MSHIHPNILSWDSHPITLLPPLQEHSALRLEDSFTAHSHKPMTSPPLCPCLRFGNYSAIYHASTHNPPPCTVVSRSHVMQKNSHIIFRRSPELSPPQFHQRLANVVLFPYSMFQHTWAQLDSVDADVNPPPAVRHHGANTQLKRFRVALIEKKRGRSSFDVIKQWSWYHWMSFSNRYLDIWPLQRW